MKSLNSSFASFLAQIMTLFFSLHEHISDIIFFLLSFEYFGGQLNDALFIKVMILIKFKLNLSDLIISYCQL